MKHLGTAFILSWFGSDDAREKRKRYHEKQVKWMLGKGLDLIILPQQYKNEDFIRNNNITYLPQPPILLYPASGKNILLKEFYKSDMDYAIIADNDSVLDKFNLGEQCIQDFNKNFKYYSDIDFFVPASDGFGSKPRLDIKNNPTLINNYGFMRTSAFPGHIVFIRNIKKYYDLEIYYDTFFDNDKILGEDVDFGLQFIVNGFGAYRCSSIITLERGSPTWQKEDRLQSKNVGAEYFRTKYRQYGVRYNKDHSGNSYINFLKQSFMKPRYVEIPIDKNKLKHISVKNSSHIKHNIGKWIKEN